MHTYMRVSVLYIRLWEAAQLYICIFHGVAIFSCYSELYLLSFLFGAVISNLELSTPLNLFNDHDCLINCIAFFNATSVSLAVFTSWP